MDLENVELKHNISQAYLTASWEERSESVEFSNYAAKSPHVDGRAVVPRSQ